MSGRSVMPWTTSVPSTTENAVNRIRSRYGNAGTVAPPVGSASAAASVTIPRMPHQPTTAAARVESATAFAVRAPSGAGRQRQRLNAAAPDTHAIRARMVAAHTAAAMPAYSTSVRRSSRREDPLELEADEDEREHVQHEHGELPDRVRRDADARRASTSAARRGDRHREDDHGEDAGEVQPLREHPDRERRRRTERRPRSATSWMRAVNQEDQPRQHEPEHHAAHGDEEQHRDDAPPATARPRASHRRRGGRSAARSRH